MYNENGLEVRASKPIKAGEEIFIDYYTEFMDWEKKGKRI